MGMWGEIGNEISDQAGADWEIGMSLLGRLLSQGDWDKATKLYQDMLSQVQGSTPPGYDKANPQDVQSVSVPMGSEGRTAQQSAIRQLQSFVDQNGMDAQARAQLQQGLGAADQQAQANRGAVMQQMARRGMQGSGAELAGLLQGNQAGANMARNSALDAAGQARQRALGALLNQGQLAGQMRGQDIGIQTNNADAERARREFNTKINMAATQQNNQAANSNYDEQLKRLQLLGQASGNMANEYQRRAKQTAGDYASVGRALNDKSQMAGQGFEDVFPF